MSRITLKTHMQSMSLQYNVADPGGKLRTQHCLTASTCSNVAQIEGPSYVVVSATVQCVLSIEARADQLLRHVELQGVC